MSNEDQDSRDATIEIQRVDPEDAHPPLSRRKKPEEKMRHSVQVLLNDPLYLGLLEVSKGSDLSAYVRRLIEEDLRTRMTPPPTDMVPIGDGRDDAGAEEGDALAHWTWNEFEAACESGSIIDDDGFGELASATHVSSVRVYPSQFRDVALSRPTWATHVVWYNK